MTMAQPGLLLVKVNVFTQLQDLGRFGGAQLGLTQGGAVDMTSARLANALVGNAPSAPLLEIGLGSIQLRALGDLRIALTGARMPISVNHQPRSRYRQLRLADGDILDIGYSRGGSRGYLAVAGGFMLTPVFGSCAMVLREKIGGMDGLPLKNGQFLPTGQAESVFIERSVAYQFQFKPKAMQHIPFVTGAQYAELGDEILRPFLANIYQVQPMSDRMGMRLQGVALPIGGQSMLSEGICLGAIQIPADGQPIVMLNDHQTVGGYPKIGAVTRLGVNALGQCRPGHLLRFERLSLDEAVTRARRHELWLNALEQQLSGL